MASSHPPEFDRYASDYETMLRQSVAASGEEPDYFAAYKIDYLVRQLDSEGAGQPASILDFGCGVGGALRHLERRYPEAHLHGADVSEASLNLAREGTTRASFHLLGDGELPLADESVDVVMAACVFHHVAPSERGLWIRELRRVLKPGGYLFIFEHNPLNPLTRKVVRECPFDADAILLRGGESTGLLRDAGLHALNLDYIVFFPRALKWFRPTERLLAKLPLGAQYAAYARR